MHGLDDSLWLAARLCFSGLLPSPLALLAYVGLGPGPELLPYFAALVSFVGAALVALLQWPISHLFGYLSRARRRRHEQAGAQVGEAKSVEAHRDASHDST